MLNNGVLGMRVWCLGYRLGVLGLRGLGFRSFRV